MLRSLFFLMLLVCGLGNSTVQAQQVVRSYADDWMVYEQQQDRFVPYVRTLHKTVAHYHLQFDPVTYRQYLLHVQLPEGSSLFINNRLSFRVLGDKQEAFLSLDSLVAVDNSTAYQLTVYDPSRSGKMPKADIVVPKGASVAVAAPQVLEGMPIAREASWVQYYLLPLCFVLLVILGLLAWALDFRLDAESIGRMVSVLLGRKMEFPKLTAGTLVSFILAVSLIGAFLLLLCSGELLELNVGAERQVLRSYGWLLGQTLLYVIAYLLLIFLLGKVYSISQITSLHIQVVIVLSTLFSLLTFIAGVFFLLGNGVDVTLFLNLLIYSLFFRAASVFLSVYRQIPFRNNYIISYFCATELLPTILAVKIFI